MVLLVDELTVPSWDDTPLAADLWRPLSDDPVPTLLIRTPYGREQARQMYDPLGWARRGWAVVHQDVRGRFGSGGVFDPFWQEPRDGAATLDWITSQPWSDGRVALMGASYLGAAQWLAVAQGHPAVIAMLPTTTTHDVSRWFTEGGTPRRGFLAWWAAGFAASSNDLAAVAVGLSLLADLARDLSGSGVDEAISAAFPPYADWLSGQGGDVASGLPRVLPPALHVAGWHDLFCEDSLATFAAAERLAPGTQRLLVGPWTHVGLGLQTAGDLDYGPWANGAVCGLAQQTDGFLAAVLTGSPTPAGVSVFVMGANAWRELPTWPPASTPLHLHLTPGGGLAEDPVPGSSGLAWEHDPADPVPSRGGRTLGPDLMDAGPRDHSSLAARPDVLSFTSDPLTSDLTVIGEVVATVQVLASGEHDLILRLLDVEPGGRAMSVVEHAHRLAGNGGSRRLVVGSTAMTWSAGHRIGLQIAASSWPRLATLPAAKLELVLGPEAAGVLELPRV